MFNAMVNTILSLYLTSLFGIQWLVLALLELLWQIILSIALNITQAMSWVVYGLLLGSEWLIDRLTRPRALFDGYQNISSSNNTASVDTPQYPDSTGGNRPGMNGIPTDWVRIELCDTDEISDLQLDNGEMGIWEEREQFMITKREIEGRVSAWLETLEG
jgi:hypothetical protein